MTERSPFWSAGWGRYQTRGLSFANYDGSSLPREPMGARIGLGSAPSGECPAYTKTLWSEPMRPIAQPDGHDFPGHVDKHVPCVTAVIEDIVVGFEYPVR